MRSTNVHSVSKMSRFVISIFLLHIKWFLKFFQWHIPRTIGNKVTLHHIMPMLLLQLRLIAPRGDKTIRHTVSFSYTRQMASVLIFSLKRLRTGRGRFQAKVRQYKVGLWAKSGQITALWPWNESEVDQINRQRYGGLTSRQVGATVSKGY